MCRSLDTATLIAHGSSPISAHDSQMTTDGQAISAFKAQIETELSAGGGNILLVSHSNIAPLYGAVINESAGEKEIPSGVIYVIAPGPEWGPVARIQIREKEALPASVIEFFEGGYWSESQPF